MSVDLGTITSLLFPGAFLYYVPLSDLDDAHLNISAWEVLKSYTSWPLSGDPRSLTLPRSFAGERYLIYTGASPRLTNALSSYHGGVLPYIIRNSDGLLSMVVTHTTAGAIAGSDVGSQISVEVGTTSALDAFYPAGRPVYLKED